MFQAAFRLPAKFYWTFLNLKKTGTRKEIARFRPKKRNLEMYRFTTGGFMSTKLGIFSKCP